MVSKGQIVGIDWNRIARLHSHVLAHMNSLTVVEHPTRSRRVVGSNPIWGSDFFRVYVFPRIYVVYHVVVISLLVNQRKRKICK